MVDIESSRTKTSLTTREEASYIQHCCLMASLLINFE